MMQPQYFILDDGSLEFSDNKIIITDDTKLNKILLLLSSVTFIFIGLTFINRWINQNDKLNLILGLLFITPWTARLIKERKNFKNTMPEIQLTDISHVTFLSNFKKSFLTVLINLKIGGHRKIKLTLENNQEEILKTLFKNYQIKVD